MYTFNADTIKISVRNLVEFICRGGDLDSRRGGPSSDKAMEAGRIAHKRIQSSMGSQYKAEVPFEAVVPRVAVIDGHEGEECNYNIVVNGRADGVFSEEDLVTIDEIKGIYKDLRYLDEPFYVHKAQAMCYGYMKCIEDNLDRIGIRMTYINLDTEEIKYFSEVLSFNEISNWFLGVIEAFSKWTDYLFIHRILRTESIKHIDFPFEYRAGQRDLVVNVYKTIKLDSVLFIQAPTGVGKTMSTVFPAVKAMGEGLTDKIFYLTAKTITRTVSEEAFSILSKQGLNIKSMTITAKEKVCLNDELKCDPVSCPYAKGHFDRVNDALYDMIMNETHIDRDCIAMYAMKHQVCPFEFSLDASYWCDAIICDYNYVFDPNVYLKRYFADETGGDYVFLVDEAHNLVDRAREMYSAVLSKEHLLETARLVKDVDKRLYNSLKKCNKVMLEMKRECENYLVLESIGELSLEVSRLSEQLTRFSEEKNDFEFSKEVSDMFFEVRHFLNMYDNIGDNYITYSENTEEGFVVKLFCVNPSANIRNCVNKGRAAVFFSATLLPVTYYKELLGKADDYAIYAHSPFDPDKRLLLVAGDVTSRYTHRNENEYRKIKYYIDTIRKEHPGNYMVFFPSYGYLNSVYELYADENDVSDIVVQKSGMNEEERESFLANFENRDAVTGFCVTGGIFSEGIDLKNESLIGCIIVGTGIPQIGTERKLLSDYYEERKGSGFDYAYTYPGFNKVMQAAGRVIRTTEDIGVIALLDDRFLRREYISLFPQEWSNFKRTNKSVLLSQVSDFWKNQF